MEDNDGPVTTLYVPTTITLNKVDWDLAIATTRITLRILLPW
jgi:hypothetical protein